MGTPWPSTQRLRRAQNKRGSRQDAEKSCGHAERILIRFPDSGIPVCVSAVLRQLFSRWSAILGRVDSTRSDALRGGRLRPSRSESEQLSLAEFVRSPRVYASGRSFGPSGLHGLPTLGFEIVTDHYPSPTQKPVWLIRESGSFRSA